MGIIGKRNLTRDKRGRDERLKVRIASGGQEQKERERESAHDISVEGRGSEKPRLQRELPKNRSETDNEMNHSLNLAPAVNLKRAVSYTLTLNVLRQNG